MTIQVTEADIRKGVRKSNTCCPIARAVQRVHEEALVLVDATVLHINNRTFDLPPAAQLFIDNFDSGAVVKPFSFEVRDGADPVAA